MGFLVMLIAILIFAIVSLDFLMRNAGTIFLFVFIFVLFCLLLGWIIKKGFESDIHINKTFVIIAIFSLVIASGVFYSYYETHDLNVKVYKVISDSDYQTTEKSGLIGPRFYKEIPANSMLAWVYHTESYPKKGKWYVSYEKSNSYVELTDFDKEGDNWNIQYIHSITYKEFKKSNWWEIH